ncbi:MAG: hypothetical protein LBC76_01925 [Treponema sp.]|jgi:hypothetical protein|nr:hypothetical protein [Treponema sp.]
MDFYFSIYKTGGYYFGFDNDSRQLMENQSYSKIGRGRLVNVVRMDESGNSYKQYSKKGCKDSDHNSVIEDINMRLYKKSKKGKFVFSIILLSLSGLFIFTIILLSFLVGFSDAFEVMFDERGGIFFFIVLLLGLILFFNSTKIKKPCLLYDISPKKEKILQAFYEEISKIDESEIIWSVKTADRHNDPKRHAGATSSVLRKKVYFYESSIKSIETNVFTPSIGNFLYFFPDVIYYYNQNKLEPIFYDKMEIQLSTSQFREDNEVPSDSEEIGSTWLYVNKDGGPDKRFGNNRKIPIMKYCEIKIKNGDEASFRIMTSNYEIGKAVANTLHNYKQKL